MDCLKAQLTTRKDGSSTYRQIETVASVELRGGAGDRGV